MKIKIVETLRKISIYPNARFSGTPTQILKGKSLLLKRFKNQKFAYPPGLREMKKTSRHLDIISWANEESNRILVDCGLSEFFIPSNNIHILSNRYWEKFCVFLKIESPVQYAKKTSGFADFFTQIIGIRNNYDLFLKSAILHEMIHFKSFHSYGPKVVRSGFYINGSGFVLDEAVTETLNANLLGRGLGVYLKERESLWRLMDKIFKNNPDKFNSRSEVFRIFIGAKFSGNLFPLARIIRKSFPGKKDVFRKLFWLKTEAHLKFVNSL